MADDATELQETLNPGEEVAQEPEQPATEEVDVEALKAQAAKADEYKKYADRVAKENAQLKKATTPNQPNEAPTPTDERFERLELKTEGYSSEEVDFLMQNGGKAALDNKIVMAGIDAIRKQAKSAAATPTGTAKSPVYQKYTERDLKNMPLAELEKIIPQD